MLCLNGGGVRGALHMGALTAYEEAGGRLHFKDGVYGVSIGAVLASMIAFGFSLAEIRIHMEELRFDRLLQPPRLQQFSTLFARFGFDTGTIVYRRIKHIFASKNLDIDTLRIADANMPLYIIASDITRNKTVIFRKSIRVWDALRASVSIPLLFTPHRIAGRLFVDGALICKNIVACVPEHLKKSALICLIDSSEHRNPTSLVEFIRKCMEAENNQEIDRTAKLYPNNVCRLTDTRTNVVELCPDLDGLCQTGLLSARHFFAKRIS